MNNQAAQTMPELPRPVAKMHYDSYTKVLWLHPAPYSYPPDGTTLHTADQMHQYARDYAASQTAGVPEGWLRACDEEMVGAHIGVADASDDYATAKKKLHDLITWHIQVATDPAVNGGFVLIPREPTPEMWKAGKSASVEAEEVYMQDRPQSVWDKFGFRKNRVKHIYNAMLAAAPAASGGERVPLSERLYRGPAHDTSVRERGMEPQATPESIPATAASVSERARELLANAYRDGGYPRAAGILEAGVIVPLDACALRALEQALTQQRGAEDGRSTSYSREALEIQGARWRALCRTIDHLSPGWDSGIVGAVDAASAAVRVLTAQATTPQPSADAVREAARAEGAAAMRENMLGQVTNNASLRELVQRWRDRAHEARSKAEGSPAYEVEFSTECGVYVECADELESLLSGGSHA